MAAIRFKRGTRAQLNTAAAASGLAQGEPYLITDESRVAVGTAASAFKAFVREDDAIVAPQTHAAAGKTTPADADELPLVDSAASNALKKLTIANLAAWVRGVALTGLDTASNAAVVATDSILAAVGKLQAQVNAKFDKSGGTIAGATSVAGNLLSTAGLIGYGPGIGGTVTQPTSKSTNVALNKTSGQVTMSNASLPGGGVVSFQIANTFASQYDGVVVTGLQTFDWSNYILSATISNSVIIVTLKNDTVAARSEALVFNFQLFRGVAS